MSFWNGKKVIVTGGQGMIGSVLSELLIKAGASVTILDNGSRGKNYVPQADYVEQPADATNLALCTSVFQDAFAVFNLAAGVGGIYYNLSHQAEQYWWNLKLQAVPVLAAASCAIPVFVQTSTVCVYANGYNNPAKEENGHASEPEPANAGYAWAKRQGERICGWAFTGTDTKYCIVRPTNAYSERDYFDERAHVIPALIKKFTKGSKTAKVYGGEQTREFIHADDIARGMMIVAECGEVGKVYNLGTSGRTVISIGDLARLIKKLTHSKTEIEFDESAVIGDRHRSTDSTRAELLGWTSVIDLEKGLERVIRYYLGDQE